MADAVAELYLMLLGQTDIKSYEAEAAPASEEFVF